ncbi:30S ribosomal protein S9 [Candidatus Woesearchaeota archaeon]|nr:30S ribosomal protein S9 [Candidatus Woesearchaeota archaeon]
MSTKLIHTAGRRKRAVARATLKPGSGKVRINRFLLDNYSSKLVRMKMQEPLIIAGDSAKGVNIDVTVEGGGAVTQADAARLAIARALVKSDKKLEKAFLNYDRQLLVADVRAKETHKPNRHGKARAKVQKSYR